MTAPHFTLRPETEADAPFRLALFRDSRGPGWNQLPLPPEMLAQIMVGQFQAQTLAYAAAFPAARLEIVMIEETPIGRLATERRDDALHLIDIALTPTWRGRGMGEAILRGLMDESRLLARPLTLKVDHDNLDAHRFYHRLGFGLMEATDTYLALGWSAPEAVA